MTTTNKQTAAIWAEKLGDAYVGCYGLLDDLDRDKDGTEEERNARITRRTSTAIMPCHRFQLNQNYTAG